MEEPAESIVEERQELMVSQANPRPTLRKAHFLKPILASIKGLPPERLSLSSPSLPPTSRTQKYPLQVKFSGWRYPTPRWKAWVHRMEPMHQSVWKQAGIYEAIKSSTCRIRRYDNLLIGLGEKWCPETNTFIFPWAEATVTLEDVMILGGYSVLGSPVFLCCAESGELKEIQEKLKQARTETKAEQNSWMKRFMYSGSEIEHEAFLSFWLERFVFIDSVNRLKACFFPLAIHLARGTRMALAPAVLASIYGDLSLLKATIASAIEADKLERDEDDGDNILAVSLWSPLQLVQLWAWERFPAIRPQPNVIRSGDPRSALWDKVKRAEIEDVGLALDSAGGNFCWRPYAIGANGWQFPRFYREKEELENLGSDENIFSFALCLRVAELAGIKFIEQYLPHRVAMQFGFDQDVPGHVARSNKTCDLAWISFIRPFVDRKLYVPSRISDCGFTVQYLEWWRELCSYDARKNVLNGAVRKKRNFRKRPKQVPLALLCKKEDQQAYAVLKNADAEDYYEDVKLTANEMLNACDKQKCHASRLSRDHCADAPPGFPPKQKAHVSRPSRDHCADDPPGFPPKQKGDASRLPSDQFADAPPGFPPICNMGNENNAEEDVKPKFEEILITCDKIKSQKNEPSNDSKYLVDQACSNTKANEMLSAYDKHKGHASKLSRDHCANVPPGFPCKQKGHASRLLSDHRADFSPGFLPICNMGNEEDAEDDVKPKFDEILITCDKIKSHRHEPSNDSKYLADQARSNTKANDGALTELGSLVKTLENKMNVKAEIDDSPERLGGSQGGIFVPETRESRNSSFETENLIFELEARIARLEKAVAQQKAERFGNKFAGNLTKEGCPGVSGP